MAQTQDTAVTKTEPGPRDDQRQAGRGHLERREELRAEGPVQADRKAEQHAAHRGESLCAAVGHAQRAGRR